MQSVTGIGVAIKSQVVLVRLEIKSPVLRSLEIAANSENRVFVGFTREVAESCTLVYRVLDVGSCVRAKIHKHAHD